MGRKNYSWKWDPDHWPDQRINWPGMTVSQKRYTINQYNRARQNRGLEPIVNPYARAGSINKGPETITPKTPGRAPITPEVNTWQPTSSTTPSTTTPDSELIKLEEFFGTAEGQKIIQEIINDNNRLEQQEFGSTKGGRRPPIVSDNSKAGPSGVGVKRQKVSHPSTTTSTTTTTPQSTTPSMVLPGTGSAMEHDGGNDPPTAAAGGSERGFSGGFSINQGMAHYVDKPIAFQNKGHMKFRKCHDMLSWGVPHILLDNTADRGYCKFMTTPLMSVPWEYSSFYMTPSEFNLLPKGAHAVHCSIKIVERNARVAFETASASTGLATLNQNKFGCYAKDILAKVPGIDRKVTFDSANPMKPTTIGNPDHSVYGKLFYGVDQNDTDFDTTLPAALFRVPINIPNYFCCVATNEKSRADGKAAAVGWSTKYSENLQFYQMNAETAGSIVYTDEYHFGFAPLGDYKQSYYPYPTTEYLVERGSNQNHVMQVDMDSLTEPNNTASRKYLTGTVNANAQQYGLILERGGFYGRGALGSKPHRQPSCHIGMRAVPKLTTQTNTTIASEFTDVQAWWEITVDLDIEYDFHNDYSHAADYLVEPEHRICKTSDQAALQTGHPIIIKDQLPVLVNVLEPVV